MITQFSELRTLQTKEAGASRRVTCKGREIKTAKDSLGSNEVPGFPGGKLGEAEMEKIKDSVTINRR